MAEDAIEGMEALLLKMKGISKEIVKRVTKVVDTAAIRVANHAKAGHTPGEGHAAGRYENQTTNLTNSIIPRATQISGDIITAIIAPTDNPALRVPLSVVMEYGPKVEVSHPFMRPAEESQRAAFKSNFNAAIRGGTI